MLHFSQSLTCLPDHVLVRDLAALLAHERTTTATLLAYLAEVDERRLYLPAAYPSMYQYCLGELHMSEDMAFKRIRAARAARRFRAIFVALAEGRLHLSAVVLLAPHLSPRNADELIAAATHKTKMEVSALLAERFPQPDVETLLQPIAPGDAAAQPAVRPVQRHVNSLAVRQVDAAAPQLVPEPVLRNVNSHAPEQVGEPAAERASVTPLAPQRYALQVTLGQAAHEKLRYAQALLGHAVPSGDIAEVLERGLDELIARLERRRFAAGARSRPGRAAKPGRHVPAQVRRAVWLRDQGQCTFVSEGGRRCAARSCLEFDHVEPVARGGGSSERTVRLRCRAHNQYAAECAFGAGFMERKRRQSRSRAAEARSRSEAGTRAPRAALAPRTIASEAAAARQPRAACGARANAAPCGAAPADVEPWLRALGFRADEARRAAARCEAIPDASLEERVRYALSGLAPRSRHLPAHVPGGPA